MSLKIFLHQSPQQCLYNREQPTAKNNPQHRPSITPTATTLLCYSACPSPGDWKLWGDECYDIVAKYIKEGEPKSHFELNTAQGTSVLLGDRLGHLGQPADSYSVPLFQGKKC